MEIAKIIYQVGDTVYRHLDQCKSNKEQCKRLADRVKVVSDTVKGLVGQLPPQLITPPAPIVVKPSGSGFIAAGAVGWVKDALEIGQASVAAPSLAWSVTGTQGPGPKGPGSQAPGAQGSAASSSASPFAGAQKPGMTGGAGAQSPGAGEEASAIASNPFHLALLDIKGTLEESVALIQRFGTKKFLHRIIRSGAHDEKFKSITEQLNQGITQLNLGLTVSIQSVVSRAPTAQGAASGATAQGSQAAPASATPGEVSRFAPGAGPLPAASMAHRAPPAMPTSPTTASSHSLSADEGKALIALQQRMELTLKEIAQQMRFDASDKAAEEADRQFLLQKQEEILQESLIIKKSVNKLSEEEASRHGVLQQQLDSMRQEFMAALSRTGSMIERKRKGDVSAKLLIPFHHLDIDKLIGEGGFGKIYLGRYLGDEVVIKMLEGMVSDADRREFLHEVKLMKQLRSAHVMSIQAACDEPGRMCYVMPYMENGDLRGYLDGARGALNPAQRHHIASGVAKGLFYLHHNGIVHRDIKSANVLLDVHLTPKLADFGLSNKDSQSTMSLRRHNDDIQWVAPEVLMGQRPNKASDVYSFGMVLWELFTQQRPFSEVGQQALMRAASSRAPLRETIPAYVPPFYRSLIEQCWAEPHQRPSIKVILEQLVAYAKDKPELQLDSQLTQTASRASPASPAGAASTSAASSFFAAPKPLPSLPGAATKAPGAGLRNNFDSDMPITLPTPSALPALMPPSSQDELADNLFAAGCEHERQQQFDKAAKCYQQASHLGHMRAKTNLGSFYFEGKGGLPQDASQAAKLFEEAAHMGHPRAMQNLSYCYETGQGVPQNPLKASEWKTRASQPATPSATVFRH